MANKTQKNTGFLRISQVLERIPISRSTWLAGIQRGVYPTPVKLSAKTTAWRISDIDALVERLGAEDE